MKKFKLLLFFISMFGLFFFVACESGTEQTELVITQVDQIRW